MSPYSDESSPPRTVLGVSLPIISLFLLLISANARSRSEDSRDSRALTSGGCEANLEDGGGGKRGFGDDLDEEANWWLMEVRGSWIDLRAVSLFLHTDMRAGNIYRFCFLPPIIILFQAFLF